MPRFVSLHQWLDQGAAPLDPASLQYRSVPGQSCRGCIFKGQHWRVCRQASGLAVRAGMPDCDERDPSGASFIYVLARLDERQMSLIDGS